MRDDSQQPASPRPGHASARPPARAAQAPYPCKIVDKFGRVFDYLRLALTERCNLRCIYCMPEEGVAFKDGARLLTDEELVRVTSVAARLGVSKLRLTGGEPLVRKGVVALVETMARVPGIQSVHMTTNGVLLARHADALREAGLCGLNISLDTLREERFATITRRSGLREVLSALDQALALGFPSVKLNTVVMRGFNDDEIADFVALTRERPITVRFIELMPFDADQVWKRGNFFGAHRIIESVGRALPQAEPAAGSSTEEHVFQSPGHRGKVAVIPAFTRSLCGTCNRFRVTADGNIRNCLFSEREFNLLALLRSGADDDAIGQVMIDALAAKAVDGWTAQREEQREGDGAPRASMTQIGG